MLKISAFYVTLSGLVNLVKSRVARFPEDFRFQLTEDEYSNLKCQSGISSSANPGYGGRRTLPYVYTEQGISMLASVLHSDVAINTSISIMRVFVEMRHFIANNQWIRSMFMQNTASALWKNVLNFFRHLLMTEWKN